MAASHEGPLREAAIVLKAPLVDQGVYRQLATSRTVDAPNTELSSDVSFIIQEILTEMAPSGPAEFDGLARLIDEGAEDLDGGPDLAHDVAAELRRCANAMRDAAN
jgi:hypothetical protein